MMATALPPDCTFPEKDGRVLSKFWYPIALSSEVQPGPFAAQLLDKKLVVIRDQKGILVSEDLSISGEGSPSSGESGDRPVKSYPAVERYSLVWTCLEPTGEIPAIPAFPQWDDPRFEAIPPVMIDIQAAAGRQVESFIDVAHFAWIHQDSFSLRNNPVVPKYEVVENATGLKSTYISSQPNMPKEMHHLIPEGFQWVREYMVNLPFTVAFKVGLPGGHELAILNSASPISARKTRLFAPTARTFDKGEPLDGFYKLQYQIFSEDQAIVEEQKPEDLPISLQEEVHIRADLASITYRKALGNLGLGHLYTT